MTPRRRDWLDKLYKAADWLADAGDSSAARGRREKLGALALVATLAVCVGVVVIGLILDS